jgi:hypothetical protein
MLERKEKISWLDYIQSLLKLNKGDNSVIPLIEEKHLEFAERRRRK